MYSHSQSGQAILLSKCDHAHDFAARFGTHIQLKKQPSTSRTYAETEMGATCHTDHGAPWQLEAPKTSTFLQVTLFQPPVS